MSIIATLRCKAMGEAIAFYTGVLDFTCAEAWPAEGDPAYAGLLREGHELHLSSHSGDGTFGQAVVILVADADALFARFRARGLDNSARPDSPVHQGPTEQTWGTREFYVNDPSGNTLRFVQRRG